VWSEIRKPTHYGIKSVQYMAEIPVLLLAAGGSTRMGQPKQLLQWGNATLIEHQIITLAKTGNPVNVVLGSNSDLIIPIIEKYRIKIIVNEEWEKGMGSSISCGITHLLKDFPRANGVLVALLDQPMVTTSCFETIIAGYKPGIKQILVSQSDSGWIGVPVLFDKFYFKYLLKLKNDEGAKKIINQFRQSITIINYNDMLEDMDTPRDYNHLLCKYANRPPE